MLLSMEGMGQSISLSTNYFDVNASPINYNCGSVRFEADPASLPADYYNLLWSPDNGVSVSFTYVGLGFIGDPTSYIKSGYYKAEFVSYTDGSLGYSLNIIQVTVNTVPNLTSSLTPSAICDKDLFTYSATSNTSTITTSFTWSRPLISGISNLINSGTNSISEILNNTTNRNVSVVYNYTLISNGCTKNQNVTLIVKPTPTVADITPQIKCNTIASDVINFSGTVTGTTYAWTNSQSTIGIAGSGSGTISSTTLTNSTNSPVVGTFTVPEKLIISDAIVLHFICGVIVATVGVGFTVIEKVPAGPAQLFAVGVTVNIPTTGLFVEFVNVVLEIVPLPLATIPIDD